MVTSASLAVLAKPVAGLWFAAERFRDAGFSSDCLPLLLPQRELGRRTPTSCPVPEGIRDHPEGRVRAGYLPRSDFRASLVLAARIRQPRDAFPALAQRLVPRPRQTLRPASAPRLVQRHWSSRVDTGCADHPLAGFHPVCITTFVLVVQRGPQVSKDL